LKYKQMDNNFSKIVILLLLLLSVFILAECGKKAPPVPPLNVPPSADDDLHSRTGGEARGLPWIIAPGKEKVKSCVTGFVKPKLKVNYIPAEADGLRGQGFEGSRGQVKTPSTLVLESWTL